jgi:hypothetical protein
LHEGVCPFKLGASPRGIKGESRPLGKHGGERIGPVDRRDGRRLLGSNKREKNERLHGNLGNNFRRKKRLFVRINEVFSGKNRRRLSVEGVLLFAAGDPRSAPVDDVVGN